MDLAPRRFGLRKRLVVLVLLPAILLAFVSVAAADRERASAEALDAVRRETGVLATLTDLGVDLLAGRGPAEVQVRAAAMGVDGDTALEALGLPVGHRSDLGEVVADLRLLDADARPFEPGAVTALQADIDDGPDQATIDEFDRLDDLARRTWEGRFDALRDDVVRAGDVTLSHRLGDLEAATRAGAAGTTLLTGLSEFWFAPPDASRPIGASVARLAQAAYELDRAVEDLSRSADPAVAGRGRTLARSIAASPMRAAVADAVASTTPGPGSPALDIAVAVSTVADGFERLESLPSFIDERSHALESSAAALASSATRSARATLLGAGVVTVLLLAGSVVVGISFERPLTRLIRATRQVGSGDLTLEPLPEDGPDELAEASAAFNDVVEALRRQEHLEYLASHDALTGLHNRAWADVALADALARAERTGAVVAVAFLDLDRFKAVNDTYGHAAGDEVLRRIGERFQVHSRAGDICARIGGDEFLLVAEGTDPAAALAMAHRMGAVIEEPMVVAGIELDVGVSIGLALGRPGDQTGELMARADLAAYRAKRDGTRVVRWRPELADDESEVVALLPDLQPGPTIDV